MSDGVTFSPVPLQLPELGADDRRLIPAERVDEVLHAAMLAQLMVPPEFFRVKMATRHNDPSGQ